VQKRDDYEVRADVNDFELDEMETALAGKTRNKDDDDKKKRKKRNRARRRSRKDDGLDALRQGVSEDGDNGLAESTITTTTAASPYGEVGSTAMGDDGIVQTNSFDEASDESGKDFKENF
jgi:hypothetical protein